MLHNVIPNLSLIQYNASVAWRHKFAQWRHTSVALGKLTAVTVFILAEEQFKAFGVDGAGVIEQIGSKALVERVQLDTVALQVRQTRVANL